MCQLFFTGEHRRALTLRRLLKFSVSDMLQGISGEDRDVMLFEIGGAPFRDRNAAAVFGEEMANVAEDCLILQGSGDAQVINVVPGLPV